MEEDIKILEEKVITLKRHIKNYEESDCKTNIYQQLIKECQAIENLIKGYRELEERNKQCIKAGDLERAVGCLMNRNDLSNYIPKSKVKELHKEYYEKAFAEPYDCTTADYKHSQAIGGWRALNKLLMEDK